MSYPKKLYKSLAETLRVHSEEEELEAVKDGWMGVEDVLKLDKPVEEVKPFVPHDGDTMEDVKPPKPLTEQYEEETGKKAIWKGKKTKGFLEWKKGRK